MKTALITCHYNWFGFERPRENLRRFLEATTGLPVYGVEAQLPGHPMQTEGLPRWLQVVATQGQVMMQKERLLNMAEQLVPDEYKALIWVDADVIFESPDWFKMTARALDVAPVVQPFAACRWLSREGLPIMQLAGIGAQPEKLHRCQAHPGFAMAARRSLWRAAGGLYDSMVVGNGDVGFASAVLHDAGCAHVQMSPEMATHFELWRAGVKKWLKTGTMHHVPGIASHLWHGDIGQRRYAERNGMLLALDPALHLTRGSNGLMTWTDKAPWALRYGVRNHFGGRKEDG